MRKVLVFGTFDLLHPGHIYFLNKAKACGDYLIVVITRDRHLLKLKNKKPVFLEKDRLKMMSSLKIVDQVVLGDLRLGSYQMVEKYKPDVICFGYDQEKLKQNFIASSKRVKSIKIYTISVYKSGHYSSRKLISDVHCAKKH